MASIAGVDISVVSHAFEARGPEMSNNIFAKIKILDYLKKKGNVKIKDGGERISENIMHGANTTAEFYSNYDSLDVTPQEGFGVVEYEWRQASVSVGISGKEKRQTSGKFALANLLESKQEQAEMSLADLMNVAMFTVQTGNAFDSLENFIDTTPATGTVGGLNAATYTWWRNGQAAGTSSSTAFDNLLSTMRTAYNTAESASKGFGPPDIAVTDQTVYEGYEGLVDSQRQYGNEKLLDLGFANLAFKSTGLIFDGDCVAQKMYWINSKALFFVMHQDAQMTPTEFVKPGNQDAHVAQVLVMGNLVCRNRASQYCITAIN